jgi:hypothetical protein
MVDLTSSAGLAGAAAEEDPKKDMTVDGGGDEVR